MSITEWPPGANNFSYAVTNNGLYSISSCESLWHITSENDVLNLFAGCNELYKLAEPSAAFKSKNRLSAPVSVSRDNDITTVSFEHHTTGKKVAIKLCRDALHRLLWLVSHREGPSGWGSVFKALNKVGLDVNKNELATRRLIHALAFENLIFNLRSIDNV